MSNCINFYPRENKFHQPPKVFSLTNLGAAEQLLWVRWVAAASLRHLFQACTQQKEHPDPQAHTRLLGHGHGDSDHLMKHSATTCDPVWLRGKGDAGRRSDGQAVRGGREAVRRAPLSWEEAVDRNVCHKFKVYLGIQAGANKLSRGEMAAPAAAAASALFLCLPPSLPPSLPVDNTQRNSQ